MDVTTTTKLLIAVIDFMYNDGIWGDDQPTGGLERAAFEAAYPSIKILMERWDGEHNTIALEGTVEDLSAWVRECGEYTDPLHQALVIAAIG